MKIHNLPTLVRPTFGYNQEFHQDVEKYLQNRKRLRDIESKHMVIKGKRGRGVLGNI